MRNIERERRKENEETEKRGKGGGALTAGEAARVLIYEVVPYRSEFASRLEPASRPKNMNPFDSTKKRRKDKFNGRVLHFLDS